MTNKPSISSLLEQRQSTFQKNTSDIIAEFSARLTQAFQRVFDNYSSQLHWTAIDAITNSTKSVMITGVMSLNIGDLIKIDDKEILLDESNVRDYNKVIKFAFPIIMLELASVDELVDHVNRLSKMGTLLELSTEDFAKVLDKTSDEFQEKILNDPSKLDAVTKPESVSGFRTAELSDSQILQLKIFETDDVRTIN